MKTIAAFDFDGTLTRHDTLLRFIRFTAGEVRFYAGFFLFTPLFLAMKLHLYPNGKTKERLFSYFYKGVPVEKFNEWGRSFSAIIDGMLRQETAEALRAHQSRGDTVAIISASIENWIRPWAERNGIDAVLATGIETDADGFLTGKFLTKNCYGQEKVNRLLAEFPDHNAYRLVAYGNGRGDRELLAFAGRC